MSAITSGLSVTAHSGGAEWANYLLFFTELSDGLGVPRPHPADSGDVAYVFERAVAFYHADGSASIRGIDLYQRSGFVLEAKEGSDQMNAPELTLFCVP